jgi:spore germination protein YaaH
VAKLSFLFFTGLIGGLIIGALLFLSPFSPVQQDNLKSGILSFNRPKVIGFLPYWLLGKAQTDYSKYINTLAYFSLTLDTDGKIRKLTNPKEEDPGWTTLKGDKIQPFLKNANRNNQNLSLLVFNADEDDIGQLISNPEQHAQNLVADVAPIMKQHGFKDLNLDVESFKVASESARANMTTFIKEVNDEMDKKNLGTLTIDISPTAFIKKYLINPKEVEPFIDYMVIMAYDYHYIGSSVTGPVAPLRGATESAEFDTDSGIKEALKIVPAKKLILGIPFYGYEWETLKDYPRTATIPSSGLTASTQRIAELMQNCSTCSAKLDPSAEENYIIYKDTETNSYHHLFFLDPKTLEKRLEYAKELDLGGVAFWALGYENFELLEPLKAYK